MNCTVKVMAQYFENYSDTKTPYWKPKGGQEFQIVINSDTILYSDELKSHLTTLVAAQSNEHCKYEYIEHDVEFIKPIVLESKELESLIQTEFAQMNKLIWRMYNENRISLEVAEELLDCHYNRTNKVYQMKEKRWDLTRAQIAWLQQIKNQNWMDEINSEMIGSILYRTDYNEDQKLKLNALRETYITYKKAELV